MRRHAPALSFVAPRGVQPYRHSPVDEGMLGRPGRGGGVAGKSEAPQCRSRDEGRTRDFAIEQSSAGLVVHRTHEHARPPIARLRCSMSTLSHRVMPGHACHGCTALADGDIFPWCLCPMPGLGWALVVVWTSRRTHAYAALHGGHWRMERRAGGGWVLAGVS